MLEAAHRDYAAGLVTDVRTLVAGELFSDFLEQAECLLNGGYLAPAASLAGAVLEDKLRRIASAKGVAIPEKSGLDKLNIELAN